MVTKSKTKATKSAATKSAAMKRTRDEDASAHAAPRYSWAVLEKNIRRATEEELALYAIELDDAALVRVGASVASQRLLTDGRR
jgi:hypothetical protein